MAVLQSLLFWYSPNSLKYIYIYLPFGGIFTTAVVVEIEALGNSHRLHNSTSSSNGRSLQCRTTHVGWLAVAD